MPSTRLVFVVDVNLYFHVFFMHFNAHVLDVYGSLAKVLYTTRSTTVLTFIMRLLSDDSSINELLKTK